jgi:hypothetical protein
VFRLSKKYKQEVDTLALRLKYFANAYLKDKLFSDERFLTILALLSIGMKPLLRLAAELLNDLWDTVDARSEADVEDFVYAVKQYVSSSDLRVLKQYGADKLPKVLYRN